ncbi:MAG: hypothetical protein ACMUEL_06030 [Flavobacteriales bacterium Tduv]
MIVDSSITVNPFLPKDSYLRSGGSEGRGGKSKSVKEKKRKKKRLNQEWTLKENGSRNKVNFTTDTRNT